MKNLSASLLFVLLALAGQLSAQTIRRVNNTGITGTNIYVDLTAAQTAAANGDIIQVEPSTTQYPAFSCTKQLTIVGPGYFLGELYGGRVRYLICRVWVAGLCGRGKDK